MNHSKTCTLLSCVYLIIIYSPAVSLWTIGIEASGSVVYHPGWHNNCIQTHKHTLTHTCTDTTTIVILITYIIDTFGLLSKIGFSIEREKERENEMSGCWLRHCDVMLSCPCVLPIQLQTLTSHIMTLTHRPGLIFHILNHIKPINFIFYRIFFIENVNIKSTLRIRAHELSHGTWFNLNAHRCSSSGTNDFLLFFD